MVGEEEGREKESNTLGVAEGDDDEEENDGVSILGNSAIRNTKKLEHYGRRDGNSSDEEELVVEEVEGEEEEGEVVDEGQYLALQEEDDQFGDFHGFESENAKELPVSDSLNTNTSGNDGNFANFNGLSCRTDLKRSPHAVPTPAPKTEQQQSNSISLPLNPSIPPLSKDKIDTVKAAMAKLNLKPPSISSITIAETLERSKIRIGDEFN